MELKIRRFNELTTYELFHFLKARVDVFVVEQKCPYPEIDDTDLEAVHLFYENSDGTTAAYLRIFPKKDEPGTLRIGRVLTTKRMAGLGAKLLCEAVQYIEGKTDAEEIYLEAQTYAVGFYQREGFSVSSVEFMEDGIPHVQMRRTVQR